MPARAVGDGARAFDVSGAIELPEADGEARALGIARSRRDLHRLFEAVDRRQVVIDGEVDQRIDAA